MATDKVQIETKRLEKAVLTQKSGNQYQLSPDPTEPNKVVATLLTAATRGCREKAIYPVADLVRAIRISHWTVVLEGGGEWVPDETVFPAVRQVLTTELSLDIRFKNKVFTIRRGST